MLFSWVGIMLNGVEWVWRETPSTMSRVMGVLSALSLSGAIFLYATVLVFPDRCPGAAYSFSTDHKGMCSHHAGVMHWDRDTK